MADYTRCRTFGHSWFDCDSDWKTDLGMPLTLRCERCMIERRDTIGFYGQLVTRRYTYPQDYRYSRGERPSRNDFRLALLALRLKETRATRATRSNGRKAKAS